MEEFSKQESLFFVVLAIAIIIVCGALVFFTLLSRPAAPYTELYFGLDSIKENAVVGEELSVNFFVENHEGQPMDYVYSVYAGNAIVRDGLLSLADNTKEEVSEKVLLSSTGQQKISVVVRNAFQEQYSIFFWVDIGEQ